MKNVWLNKQILQRISKIFVAVIVLTTFSIITPQAESEGNFAKNYEYTDPKTKSEESGVLAYSEYISKYSDARRPNCEIIISSEN